MALDFSKFGTPVEQTPVLDFSKFGTPVQPPEKQSAFRQIADVPLGIAKGAVQGVRMIADAFGAGSDTSKTIKSAETYLADLMSAQAKNDQQEIARIMKDAEDKGVLDQVKAGIKAFTVAPIDTLSGALGTAGPVIIGALGAKVLGAGALVTTGVSALTGAGMGAGTIKGSIYEETKNALKEAGASEQDAEARAKLAQEYGGKNLDQILLGTVLGGAAAVGPLEKGGAAILARRILGKTGAEGTETVAGQAAKGAVRRRLEAGALEAVPEAVQAGQEQVAQNIALQREGFDVPTFRGAVSSATLEGLAGAGLGATVGGGKPAAAPEVPPPEAPPPPPALEYKPEPFIQFPDGTVAKRSEVEAYIKTLPEDQQMAMRAKLLGLAPQEAEAPPAEPTKALEYKPEPLIVYPDGSVARSGEVDAYIQSLPEDEQIAARAKLLGMGEEATRVTPEMLRKLGIRGRAPVIQRLSGLELTDPKVTEELTNFAAQPYASPEVRGNIFGFLNTIKPVAPPVEPAAKAPPVAPAPPPVAAVEPSVAEDSELVTPAPVVEAAAPATPKFEPQIISRQPAPDGMEIHVFTTTDGYGTGLFDADANQYVNGSVTRFAGEDTLPKAEARAAEMLQKATPVEAAAPVVEEKPAREPSTRKEAEAFGKAIGAAQPYPGELRGRVNLPAQKAAKEGNFQGVLSALEKSKNVIVAEIAKRAKSLGTKIVIDEDAEETYTGPSTLMRQMTIDGAKMHLEALNKIRALAPKIDALPDGFRLGYDITGEKINAIDQGKDAGRMSLGEIADMGHSMFAPLATGPFKLKTKEDFKRLQKAYEDLTSEYGENALQLTSTGSAEMRGVAGAYDADTDTIRVPEYTAKREEVLSHEIVHAQTVQSIANPTLRQKPIVARLNKLYEHVKKELEGRPGRAPYGIQSIQEFVAEGMGNPAFQFLLKKIKYENTSAWDSFVQTIANLIGVKRDTAFTELLSIYSDLTTEQKAPAAPTVEAAAPKAEAPPTLDTSDIKEVKGRHPQVQAAAKLLQDKKISREEFEKYVDYYKPIQEVESEKLLPPTSEQRMNETVNADKRDRINVPVEDGTKVGLRMDLPARERGGSVVSIHEGKPGKMTVGKLMGFRSTGWLKDVTFEVRSQEKGLAVAAGASKAPQQTVEGTWQNLSPEETYARVKELMKDPAWKQIGFDPSRHGYFYDRKTTQPVVSASEMYQVGQFLLAKDVKYAPKENYLYSVEPTVKSDRLPSYKRGVENLRKRWEKGDLTSDEFAGRVDILARQIENAELAKDLKPRERGADFIRQRLLEAKRRGELTAEAVDFAEWFILRNPKLVDDLAISIKTPKEGGVGGAYESVTRLMTLMKDGQSDYTTVHEILHHLERMMPEDVRSEITKSWFKALVNAEKNAKTEAEVAFIKKIMDYHLGVGGPSDLKNAIKSIQDGTVDRSFYQYTNPSEFWAENGARIMGGRYLVKSSVLKKLKQWLYELKEKIKDVFGFDNRAAIIRALDSLSKGDGKFVTNRMLDEGSEPKLSVTQQGTPGEQAISIVNSLGMGVKPPEPGRAEKAMKFLKDAGENPSLTKESAKKTLTKWLDWFETTVFSSDSAFNNKIRRGIISDFKQNPEVLGMLLEASQSQTVHADALASQFMIDGGLQYNDDLKKWESVKKDDNFVALAKKIEDLATKYNVTKDEMERIAHTYFVAKRLPGIIKRNEELDASIAAERATAKPDRKQIEEWESLKVFVSDEQLAMMEPGLSLVKTIPELKEVVDIWQGIRKNNIEVMVNSGLWSPEYAQRLWDNMDYVPYYREEQLEEGAGPQEFIRGLQVKSKEFQLKGSGAAVNDVFDNMIRWSQYAMNRAVRAHKATQMIDAALKIEVDGKPMATKVTEQKRGMNIVRAFRDGKQELYDMADPLFVPAFSSIQNVSIPTLTFMAKVSNVLRQSVVLYPLFSVAQVPQDSFAAMFSSGLKTQHALKIPYLAVKEFIKTLSKTSQTHNELKRFGVVGVRDFSATVIRDDAEIYAGLRPPKGGWGKTKEFLEHIAMSADNAVRQAVYEASMQQGLNKSEALEKAFEIINFRRRGTSKMLNVMGQTVPFFYAYLSAQRVAYRVLSGVGISPSDRKEALTTLATTSAAVAALSMLYAMANGDDEDYAETPAAIRDRTLTIPGSGGVRIPLRPDFFLFPKIVAEHTYLMLSDKGYEDGAKFRKSMADALLSAVASPTPFPTAIKPAIEVAINYDFFQGKPLIGTFEKQKDIERQFRDSTSELAKILSNVPLSYSLEKGKFEGMSPIAIDHMIRGMLGSFGGLVLFGTNQFLHSDPDVPRPEMSATEMLAALPGTSGLLKRPQESALKNDFFVLRDEVEKAANTFNDIKTRSPEGIQAFLEDEKNAIRLGMAKGVDKINRHLSDIRRRMTIITNMPESQMSADEKAQNIRELRELEREILRSVNVKELREMAKI
jgi:hypothetical protein